MGERVDLQHQVPRRALFWLLTAQAALVAPHAEGLPWWLFVVCAVCGAWRVLIYRQWLSFPGALARSLLVAGSLAAVVAEYAGQVSLDPMVAMLVIAFFLKLLETRRLRDIYVVAVLGFFIAATRLLYSQTVYATLYAVGCCLLLLLALLGLHQSAAVDWRAAGKRILVLTAQATPVLLVLFFLFPRLPPLWSVPLPQEQGTSGIDDQLSPGNFAELAQDPSPVFRVSFAGAIPPPGERYWGGLVFDRLEGVTWRQSWPRPVPQRPAAAPAATYTVTLEPHNEYWLFTLPDSAGTDNRVRELDNGMLVASQRVRQRTQFRFGPADAASTAVLSDEARLRNLQLPALGNERTREWARDLARDFPEPRARVEAILRNFADRFSYTLRPGVLGQDNMDQFLFDTRRGYCEHFAAALVYTLRAGGVPARIIGGYQGGEQNPYENYLLVRQLDAHAWAEVWLEGEGWVRFDPTSVVAPERIAAGAETALRARNEYAPRGLLGFADIGGAYWFNVARLYLDSVNYQWTRWFLGYDRQAQSSLLLTWWGKSDLETLLRLLVAGLGTVIGVLFLWTVAGQLRGVRRPLDLATAVYLRLGRWVGVEPRASDTVAAVTGRLATSCPRAAGAALRFQRLHEQQVYAERKLSPRQRRLQVPVLLLAIAAAILFSRRNESEDRRTGVSD